jgi:adenine-specific DNA-methyltransferase
MTEPLADAGYVRQPMITMIGNKRKLVCGIYSIVKDVWLALEQRPLRVLDGFAGSGVVSRMLASSPEVGTVFSNDLEKYSQLCGECYLKIPSEEEQRQLVEHIAEANRLAAEGPFVEGVVSRLYAPHVTSSVQVGERCFYTRENALVIDTIRDYIERHVEVKLRAWILAPLLVKASIHTNTGGVFKGFYKKDGVGHFGGEGENALERIMAPIRLEAALAPRTAAATGQVEVFQEDINTLLESNRVGRLDLIYLDPPYNQHPYGSNYFMLNVIASGEEPQDISGVSGIPRGWNKSRYNKAAEAGQAMKDLLEKALAKAIYVLISYNNEGIIKPAAWEKLLEGYKWRVYERPYDAYKASRNLEGRPQKVVEKMYLVCSQENSLP